MLDLTCSTVLRTDDFLRVNQPCRPLRGLGRERGGVMSGSTGLRRVATLFRPLRGLRGKFGDFIHGVEGPCYKTHIKSK
jgi:hypothetical protein